MSNKEVLGGTVHKMQPDIKRMITSSPKVLSLWQDITPLARNEWICWIESGKKAETRGIRLEKARSKLSGGMRRPCCWAGCIHR
ncbi:YdeI/OmpD-associated family protein [Candidatus Parcubacteria bacterium]|nr:YdeI/OmpD-associated family protein [Candidatus Parcubacteria bacterium]